MEKKIIFSKISLTDKKNKNCCGMFYLFVYTQNPADKNHMKFNFD